MLNFLALPPGVKISLVLLSLFHSINDGTLPFPDVPQDYSSGDLWKERSMFCLHMEETPAGMYYGIIFGSGKTKTLQIDNDHLLVPENIEASHYTLVTIYGAKKVFWKNNLGVNSLDRKNFVHLLNGKAHGWCQPHSSQVVLQKLKTKLKSGESSNPNRTILDDFK